MAKTEGDSIVLFFSPGPEIYARGGRETEKLIIVPLDKFERKSCSSTWYMLVNLLANAIDGRAAARSAKNNIKLADPWRYAAISIESVACNCGDLFNDRGISKTPEKHA